MRKSRALASAGAAVAVLGLAAPVAVADGDQIPGSSNIVVLPSVIARGGQLAITVDGCPHGGHAASDAFPRTELRPLHEGGDTAKGIATVDFDARAGSYDITVHCSGQSLTRPAAFTVLGGVRGGLGGSTDGATPADIAIGSGLVTAAVTAGGVFWMRRRAEKQI
ncbi:hypothetical protein DIZ27_32750 [Streptomyces sp. NWU339]|uniref:hypothetical protein n=1 Tax=Streptomyces sp. NWU339 TaxID=2185284 RepID=UPI000D683A97|nr:hypothetical protein [Streptomyces sp. NWU339]PWI06622.1 hypothetical protein DIZ27_32750 [Streptomyces sp. NWU339]